MTNLITKQPNSRMCFICGLQNPVGLKMALYNDLDNQQVVSHVTVPEHFQGYPGVVHGGIVATMLDEVSGRAVLIDGNDDNLMVTVKLEVKYRQPTPTQTLLTVIGKVESATSSRAKVHGYIQLPDGTITAEADLILARPPQDFKDRWEDEKQHWKIYPDQ
jgi:uncharacterized protein (TIGR00369 family)